MPSSGAVGERRVGHLGELLGGDGLVGAGDGPFVGEGVEVDLASPWGSGTFEELGDFALEVGFGEQGTGVTGWVAGDHRGGGRWGVGREGQRPEPVGGHRRRSEHGDVPESSQGACHDGVLLVSGFSATGSAR